MGLGSTLWRLIENIAGDKLEAGFVFQRAFLKIVGLYYWEKPTFIKRIHGMIVLGSMILCVISVLCYISNAEIKSQDDFIQFLYSLIIAVAFACPIYKLTIMHLNPTVYKEMIEFLESFPPDGIVFPAEFDVALHCGSVAFLAVGWSIRSLILTGWAFDVHLPWDQNTLLGHLAGLAFQVFVFLCSMSTVFLTDAMILATIEKLRPQIKVLKNKLSKIGADIAENDKLIRESIELHVAIQRGVYMINKALGCMLLFQMIYLVPFICIMAFVITQISDVLFIITVSMPTTMTTFMSLRMYCGGGQLLATDMENVGFACYNNEWYKASVSNRKDLAIMMECSKKQVTINAYGVVFANNATFLATIQQGYSYFLFLHTMVDQLTQH